MGYNKSWSISPEIQLGARALERFLALDLTAVPHLPSHSRQINYDAVSLPNHPPT